MATEGGEERKGYAVPVPVVTGARSFIGSWTINPLLAKYKPGMESLVAWFACCHEIVSAVVIVLAISFVAVLGKADAYHHICQDDACPLVMWPALSIVVEILATMLMLALLFTGWWSRVLSFFALLMVTLTVKQSARLIYVALSGSHCCFGGDIVKPAVAVAVVIVGQLALSFWSAKVIVRFLTHSEPSTTRSSSVDRPRSVHCMRLLPVKADGNRASNSDLKLKSPIHRISSSCLLSAYVLVFHCIVYYRVLLLVLLFVSWPGPIPFPQRLCFSAACLP